jgi:hypothetical protein
MILPIRRPVRPQPEPLREKSASETAKRPDCVWLSVRHKRSRAAVPARAKFRPRGLAAAAKY